MVSIIIPLYNVENYVVNSLMSAFSQDFKDIEYLLIDDCSTDNTMNIVNDFINKHPRANSVRIIHHNKNLGLSEARNTGLLNAHGDYIFFMDSDDIITEDCISKHYQVIQKNPDADFSVANIQLEGAKSLHIKPITSIIEEMPPLESYLKKMWNVSACNKLYKKSFILDNSLTFKSGLYHEDILWSYNIAKKSCKIVLVDKFTYIYKTHSNSITTHKNDYRKLDSLIFILTTMINDFHKLNKNHYNIFFFKFIDFWRLNSALLLLNYKGNYYEQSKYYNKIQRLSNVKMMSVYSLLVKLPYPLFYILVKPMYVLYKYTIKI